MDHQRREYILEVFADQTFVKDIVKGVLHMIFFHRYFPSIRPSMFSPSTTSSGGSSTTSHSHSSGSSSSSTNLPLPLPLPAILDPPEIDSLIESQTQRLIHQLTTSDNTRGGGGYGGGVRGEIVVQFFDRKRRKAITAPSTAGGWLTRLGGVGVGAAVAGVTGTGGAEDEFCWEEWVVEVVVARPRSEADRIKVRRATESSLTKTAFKILSIVNRDKDHIPPITTSDANPFPYRILVNPKQAALAMQGSDVGSAGAGYGASPRLGAVGAGMGGGGTGMGGGGRTFGGWG